MPKLLFLITLFLFSTKSLFAQESTMNSPEHLKVQRLNDSYIDVYYNKPVAGAKLPLLIFCQGSGYDSNTDGFLNLMRQFEKKAVGLAIEKQGVKFGDSGDTMTEVYRQNNAVYNRFYDYLRVLQYMRGHANWWNGDVYIIGGSEGGLLAGMLASFYPNTKSLALFSFGGGLNFGEAWPVSIASQKKAEGANDAEIAKAVNDVKDTFNLIRQNPSFNNSYEGKDNTYAWWASIIDLRLENALLDLKIPIYLVQGSDDIMSPLISARKMNEDFIKKEKTNLHYEEYQGYDHEYKDSKGESHLVEVIMKAIEWMLNQK